MKTAMAMLLVVGLTGCAEMAGGGAGGGDDDGVIDPGGDDDVVQPPPPPPPPPPPADLATTGVYTVVTHFDVTASALLPQQAYDGLSILAGLRSDPAGTMITLLDDAGVPLVDELFALLPDYLETKVKGWINAYVGAALYGNATVNAALDELFGYASASLGNFDLVTELEIIPGDDGTVSVVHTAIALRVVIAGETFEVAIPAAEAPVVVQVIASASIDADPVAAQLTVGEHAFGLAYGEYVYDAFEQAVLAHYGMGLRDALGAVIDCPALAASVAGRCVLGVCVGHASELQAICEAGLDEAVDQVHDRFAAERFDAVKLSSGTAAMTDTGADGQADRLENGVWQAEIDLGQGLRAVPATFTGERAAD